MPTAPTPHTPLPTAPSQADRPNFAARAEAFAAAQEPFGDEMDALATNAYNNAVEAAAAAAAAAEDAAAAEAARNAIGGRAWTYSTSISPSGLASGGVRVNGALGSASEMYISEADALGASAVALLERIAAGTSTVKAVLTLASETGARYSYKITGSTDGGDHRALTLSGAEGSGTITNGSRVWISAALGADKGDPGAQGPQGPGDVLKPAGTGNTGKVAVMANDAGQLTVRPIGASSATDLLDRAAGDGRYQQLAANITALAGLTGAADKLPYFTGAGAMATVDLSTYMRGLLATASQAALKAALSLAIADVSGLQAALDAKQASNAKLTALAGLSGGADILPYFTGTSTMGQTTLTALARTILGRATVDEIRTDLLISDFSPTPYPGTANGSYPLLTGAGEGASSDSYPSFSAGTIYFVPLIVPVATAAWTLYLLLSAAGVNKRVGLFAQRSNGLPGACVWDSGDLTAATVTSITSTTSIAAGKYWVGFRVSGACQVRTCNAIGSTALVIDPVYGSPAHLNYLARSAAYSNFATETASSYTVATNAAGNSTETATPGRPHILGRFA